MTRPLLAVVAVVILGARVLGQSQQPAAGTAALTTFDAAAIKPTTSAPLGVAVRFYPNRFVATAADLGLLIQRAYGIEDRELVGGPDWVRNDWFDVTATTREEVTPERMRLMLQALLAERFQLQLTRETRTGAIYRLSPRSIRNLNPPARPDERSLVSTIRNDGNGLLSFEYVGHNATIGQLALALAANGNVRAPVIDETKLTGKYDFRVSWTYDNAVGGLQPDPNIPTLFTALERDLGLKLVADKGPVPVHVIQRVSKPSAN